MSTVLDISPFLEAKSDQITADDLIAGPRSFVVARVEAPGGDQPLALHMEGYEGKPFKPCKGMRRLLAQLWGEDAAKWVGRSVTLFRDPDVHFGAEQTGGVRVAAVSHMDLPATVPVRVSRRKIKPYTVQPLKAEEKSDKAAEGAAALIERIEQADDVAAIVADVTVAKQRAWLSHNRPELAAKVDAAFAAKQPDEATDNPFETDEQPAAAEEGSPSDAKLREAEKGEVA